MGFGINHTLDESGRIVQQERESIRRKACREDMRNIAQRKVSKAIVVGELEQLSATALDWTGN